jgi:hypothetical protein
LGAIFQMTKMTVLSVRSVPTWERLGNYQKKAREDIEAASPGSKKADGSLVAALGLTPVRMMECLGNRSPQRDIMYVFDLKKEKQFF